MTDTPFLTVDVARCEANIADLAARAASAGVAVRPHAKTHKCAEIARLQMDHGAVGLTVATIGEAEAFADAAANTTCSDLFIAYPLWVTESKAARLAALAQRVSVRVGVDSIAAARQLAAMLNGADGIDVVIEVDSGHHRTGCAPEDAGIVAAAAADAGLDVAGVFTFPGHGYGVGEARLRAAEQEVQALDIASERLRANGIDPRVCSGGSTPTVGHLTAGVLTEIRPGVYPFNDAQQVAIGSCDVDAVALWADSTVVHRSGTKIALDAGSKILGADRPPWLDGYGLLPDYPGAQIISLSEHHAVVELPAEFLAGDAPPEPGTRVRVVPNHVCTAANLVDELIARLPDGTEEHWAVMARGRNS